MPKPPAHMLIWSAEQHLYMLYTPGHPPRVITLENEGVWGAWLATHSSFAFQGQHGHLNVLKEARSRGTGYWYAYHKRSGRNRKRYLGTSATVTLARLEEMALALQSNEQGRFLHMSSSQPYLQSQSTKKEIPFSLGETGSEYTDIRAMMAVTRLSPPRLPATLVSRERLLLILESAFTRPLTLLSASAGWGKTTLLSAWAHSHLEVVAWLSLEPLDNDPTRFWISLIQALRKCCPEIGEQAQTLLQASAPLATSLTALLNELADRFTDTSPLLLILDDYHVIEDSTIHASLTFWLEHLPPHVHFLLASRIDPDLPLARFRVRGQLGEIRDTDLRFTREETQHFLTQSMGLVLSEVDMALLETRTEGWIAGLQLAALILQKHSDPSVYVQTLSGSQRFLLDYLREEVLESLPEALQDFLLQTSVLHRLSASLCDAITGREDSDRLLDQVERANLFLQPLDEHRQWYRYHMLWTQAMQHEARRRLGTAVVRSLSSKASQWYEQQHMLPEAIEAALTGEDFGRVASLIERFVVPQSFRNAYHMLSRWLRQLPGEIVRTRPDLCFVFVLALTFTTDRRSPATWEQVERLLQWAKQGFEATQQWDKLGDVLQLHAELTFFQDDLVNTLVLARQARPLLTKQSLVYPENILMRGLEAFLAGEVEVACQYLLEGYRRAKRFSNHSSMFATSLMLGGVCLEKGEIQKASLYYHQALAHIEEDQEAFRQQLLLETGGTEPFFFSWAYHCLAQLSYERNEIADARRSISQALVLRDKPEEGIHVLASGAFIQARLMHVCGEPTQALDLLWRWEKHTRSFWSLRAIHACRARLQLANGNLSAVEQWDQEKEHAFGLRVLNHEQGLLLLQQQEEALLLVRLYIAQKKGEAALKLLVPWKEKALAQRRKRSVLEILILEALAYAASHDHNQARSSLREALKLAHTGNYQRLFLDEGRTMEALLNMLLPELRETSLVVYVSILLRAFTLDTSHVDDTPANKNDTPLLEPLSLQEQRILRLLVAGQSNPEIARSLVISVNTVRTHVQSLYRKLGVHNRVQASEAARRFSLL